MSENKALIDIINDYMASGEIRLPVMSKSATLLQEEVTKEDPDPEKLESYIKMDPALTSEILSVANSSYYKGIGTVESIKEAGLRIGLTELSNVIMVTLHRSRFKATDPFLNDYIDQLWQHSIACAMGSSWLARHLSLHTISGKVFIAGMLHDVGKLFLATAVEAVKKIDKDFAPSEFLIEKMMNSLHAEQGYNLLVHWNLPEVYCNVARDHHAAPFDTASSILAIVRLVNRVCNKLGIGPNVDELVAISGSEEVELLDISEITLAELEIAIEDAVSSLKG